ncbi:low-specificity L-threonine aldolase 1-like [Bidens hawaiensis]|uniref:low-specificity L-threonine aldolase 1-like n=1 Tax=Bidens hawaiensis TaxID=980011 RepID=UPI00404A27F2
MGCEYVAVALRGNQQNMERYRTSSVVCLSKGLGASIGSVIVGAELHCKGKDSEDNFRGWNEAANAKIFSKGLNKIKGLRADVASVETNIVYFEVLKGSQITALKLGKIMKEHGILLMPDSSSRFRIVIHHQVFASDVEYTI